MSVKVKFTSRDSGKIFVRGSRGIKSFTIPAYGEKVVEVPETEQAERLMNTLTSRFKVLKATLVESEGEETPLLNEEDIASEGTATEGDPDFEEFKGKVKSADKRSGGWWWIILEEKEDSPIKVRGAQDEAEAILLAYNEYKESEAAE